MKYLKKFSTPSEREFYMTNHAVPDLPYVHYIESTKDVVFSSPETDVPLYIKFYEGAAVSFSNNYEYSRDNITWISATSSTMVVANAGEVVFFRATGLVANSSKGIGTFNIVPNCSVGGNIMSMVYGADYKGQTEITQKYQFYRLFDSQYVEKGKGIIDASALALPATTLADYCYSNMFYKCTGLVNAPALPATTLANYCYYYMFRNCTSLVNPPALPATTLANYCYNSMFYGCTSLVNAPALPATTLATSCYSNMFYKCTSLVNASALPATTLASSCYYYMFYGCTSLVNAPALPATALANYCYGSMFNGCTSLVNAPALPATTLATSCYNYMFNGCTSLSYIKALCTTTPGDSYTKKWMEGVASSGTFVKNSAATWNVVGVNGIPEGWTVETADA